MSILAIDAYATKVAALPGIDRVESKPVKIANTEGARQGIEALKAKRRVRVEKPSGRTLAKVCLS